MSYHPHRGLWAFTEQFAVAMGHKHSGAKQPEQGPCPFLGVLRDTLEE
jgi:hypothetical protein